MGDGTMKNGPGMASEGTSFARPRVAHEAGIGSVVMDDYFVEPRRSGATRCDPAQVPVGKSQSGHYTQLPVMNSYP